MLKIRFLIPLFVVFVKLAFAQQVTMQWATQFSGAANEEGIALATDPAGNVYTCGIFNGTIDLDPGPADSIFGSVGGTDIFISKIDPFGNMVWAKTIGGFSNDYVSAIAVDSMQNVLVTGSFQGTVDFDPGPGLYPLTAIGGNDIFVAKIKANGNLEWAFSLGSDYNERGLGVALDKHGNFVVCGEFESSFDFDPGPGQRTLQSHGGADIFICKFNSQANLTWVAGMGGNSDDAANSVAIDGNGNVIITGWFGDTVDFNPGAGVYKLSVSAPMFADWDSYVCKLDSLGNFVFADQIGTPNLDQGLSVATDKLGNIYSTGMVGGTADFDPGPDSLNLIGFGYKDIYVNKLSPAGNLSWAKHMGGQGNEYGLSIAIDDSCNVYTTGVFDDTGNYNPGFGVMGLYPAGSYDVFISKLDSSGTYRWAGSLGGQDIDQGSSITVDKSFNIYTTGYFRDYADFNPDTTEYNLWAEGGSDCFLVKLLQGIPNGVPPSPKGSMTVFPNPCKSLLSIHSAGILRNAKLFLYDVEGRKLLEKSGISGENYSLDVSGMARGIYFLEIENGGCSVRRKVIKE